MNIDQDRQMLMVDDNIGNQNQNGLSVVPGIAKQHGNGNVVVARAEGACDEIEKVTANYGSAVVHHSENYYDNDIFNMFNQEEKYAELLEPIPEPHQLQQNDSNVISAVSSVEQSRITVEQHLVNVEETHVLYDSLYNNLAIGVEKVNSVNQADESLAKHKALELEIERLLRGIVSQDIMSIMQNPSVVDSSNLQTELERTKKRFENCIIKKENEYAKLWNDWYKKW
ncbi:hypothetical protein Tco_0020199 [Tanacetum coccineum]